jgi:molybdenum cofactor cytidylyltransferase
MIETPESARIYAIVLAAGSSSRFGTSKQLAEWDGNVLVKRAADLASSCCSTRSLLLAGHDWQAVRAACRPFPGCFVLNDNHQDGIGSSLALAVRAIRHTASAVLVLLADQPLITTQHLARLIESWSGDEHEIVASSYANTTGVPALFASGCFDQLASLSGDQGARALLQDARFRVREIVFEDAATDIDSVDDLARLERNARS